VVVLEGVTAVGHMVVVSPVWLLITIGAGILVILAIIIFVIIFTIKRKKKKRSTAEAMAEQQARIERLEAELAMRG
jgi:uncharacterized protein (UPF0333 family)